MNLDKKSSTEKISQITVFNDLAIERANETVTVSLEGLAFSESRSWPHIVVKNMASNEALIYQLTDTNNDGVIDSLIFQVEMSANSSKQFQFSLNKKRLAGITDPIVSYSRFVPERIDDYAWENDKVAFRVFGPQARKLVDEGKRGGIISSGVDCWLKRVDYPILNKWYQKHADGTGDYHKDTGEGLDNYHVGKSLGCGASGSFYQGALYSAGNFSGYKTHAVGAIRTSFELGYSPWDTGTAVVKEVKRISLDKGSNLTRYELLFDQEVEIVAGLALDINSLSLITEEESGVFSSWRKQQDSELGLGIVAEPKYVTGFQTYIGESKDTSHLFVKLKSIDKRIVYYAGFAWQKSQQFRSKEEWQTYLKAFSLKLSSPLRVEIE
ncbi:hypothetical protein A9Q81_24595 [Gammaproteobacteria bacterium 42_54_T18]|nr:hypothetical protein A9Q81_24595 [Gammaproteobacteria bacterium 42_54_T18]